MIFIFLLSVIMIFIGLITMDFVISEEHDAKDAFTDEQRAKLYRQISRFWIIVGILTPIIGIILWLLGGLPK